MQTQIHCIFNPFYKAFTLRINTKEEKASHFLLSSVGTGKTNLSYLHVVFNIFHIQYPISLLCMCTVCKYIQKYKNIYLYQVLFPAYYMI